MLEKKIRMEILNGKNNNIMQIEDLINIQKELSIASSHYFQSNNFEKIEDDIKNQLHQGKGFLLFNIFLQAEKKTKKKFLGLFVESAIKGKDTLIGISGEVLSTIGGGDAVKDEILKKILEVLKQQNIEESLKYFYYRNTAQLLYDLNYTKELKRFVDDYCKDSDDIDIRDVYSDFSSN